LFPGAGDGRGDGAVTPGGERDAGAGGEPGAEAGGEPGAEAGLDLGAIVAAASRVDAALIWPRDVSREGDLGRAFAARIAAMAGEVLLRRPARLEAALDVARLATL